MPAPRCAGPLSSQVGGPVNYLFFCFWLFIAFAGWAITLGSLSALQHYENKSGLSDGGNGALLTFQKFLKGAQEGVGLFNGPGGALLLFPQAPCLCGIHCSWH